MAVIVRRPATSTRPGVAAALGTAVVARLASAVGLAVGAVVLWAVGAPQLPALVLALGAGAVGARRLGVGPARHDPLRAGPPAGGDAGARTVLRVVCHEFRTPVAALRAVARALGSDGGSLDDDDRRRALALVEQHVEHLALMLDSVRRADEALCSGEAPRCVPVALADLVGASAAAAGVTGSRLEVRVGPGASEVRTDAEKVRRILTNLLENAARHGRPGAPVAVEVVRRGRELHVEVADRGPGVTPALQAALAATDPTAGPGGGGLGLWIVGRLARSLGGSVTASPRPGGGSLLRVVLPVG